MIELVGQPKDIQKIPMQERSPRKRREKTVVMSNYSRLNSEMRAKEAALRPNPLQHSGNAASHSFAGGEAPQRVVPDVSLGPPSKPVLPAAQQRLMVPTVRVQAEGAGGLPRSLPTSRKGTVGNVGRNMQMSTVKLSEDASGFNFNNYQDRDVSTNNDDADNQNSLGDFASSPVVTELNLQIGGMAIYANEKQVAREAMLMQSTNNPLDKIEQEDNTVKGSVNDDLAADLQRETARS